MIRKEVKEYEFGTKEMMHSHGTESTRYIRDGKIYKFLFESCRKNRDVILEGLHNDKIINIPTPIELLTTDGVFVGYTMPNYDDLYTLEMFIMWCDYCYKGRKEASTDLINALNELIKRGYEHYDLHDKNIMLIDGKARIIDIDSMCNPRLGVSVKDSSYCNIANSDIDSNKIILEMKRNIAIIIFKIMLTHKCYNPYDTRKMFDEFVNDEIMQAYVSGKLSYLIENGCSLEEMLKSITEEKASKFLSLRKKLNRE